MEYKKGNIVLIFLIAALLLTGTFVTGYFVTNYWLTKKMPNIDNAKVKLIIPNNRNSGQNDLLVPPASPNESKIKYVRFNEDFQTGTPKYTTGDSIILGDQCSTRIKGGITTISDTSFTIQVVEKESGAPANQVFKKINPYAQVINSSTYLPNDNKAMCMDIRAKGTRILLEKLTDNNQENYLNILQTLDSVSTMPPPPEY